MGVESGDTIASLNEAWPAGAEPHSQGDDHLRLIKHVLKSDAFSKADGGIIVGPVTLPPETTIGGSDIASAADLAGKADVDHTHAQVDITNLEADLALKAPLASPAFTGFPAAPTATEGTNTTQIATTAFVTTALSGFEGGGGGSGDDLDTTLVAPVGSATERTMPEWLAGGPVFEIALHAFVSADHRGAWLHMMNDLGSIIVLPDDWLPGMAFGARQVGTGTCVWECDGGATLQLPASKATHIQIAEQYEEVIFRVISNSDGTHAVWGISGGTF